MAADFAPILDGSYGHSPRTSAHTAGALRPWQQIHARPSLPLWDAHCPGCDRSRWSVTKPRRQIFTLSIFFILYFFSCSISDISTHNIVSDCARLGPTRAYISFRVWSRSFDNSFVRTQRGSALSQLKSHASRFDFVSGEPLEREGKPTKRFRGQLIYFTNADLTIRRPSEAILVIDRYEVVAISEGKARFEPH